ncbi:MAG TPA: sigma-70 family RNA polymerase sigma factor [Gemmatimonadaceae bacterium]|nr:sigma-70 family RNA polymerase sigma factor [Gemmatimonadaceae bacterium]
MDERELLAERFEANRAHLRSVAYRVLGSSAEADDAVQESWLRMSRAGAAEIDNLGGWMTTIVGRVCLDVLRSRKSRAEESLGAHEPEPAGGRRHERNPEDDAALADAVGMAMLIVLEKLAPAERVAFVLHDMFCLSINEIAPIVRRSSVATRQLASRARRRIRGSAAVPDPDRQRQREVVEAFLAAARQGDLATLVSLLDPEVVFTADAQGVKMGGPRELAGSGAVAEWFNGQAQAAVAGLVDGEVGALVEVKGRMLLVLQIAVAGDGRIAAIDAVANRDLLDRLVLERFAGASAAPAPQPVVKSPKRTS